MNDTGKGEVIRAPDHSEVDRSYNEVGSRDFQWLPCDVTFAGETVKISSYINNLHPNLFAELYSVIEEFIAKAVPLWDLALSSTYRGRDPRIIHAHTDYDHPNGSPPEELEFYEESYFGWIRNNRVLKRPEPGHFKPYERLPDEEVNLREDFGDQGLQVIVKLANIELTPEKPAYEDGSWHIEGQLNEGICATALYYYDSNNIEDSFLAFRHGTAEPDFEAKTHDQVRKHFQSVY